MSLSKLDKEDFRNFYRENRITVKAINSISPYTKIFELLYLDKNQTDYVQCVFCSMILHFNRSRWQTIIDHYIIHEKEFEQDNFKRSHSKSNKIRSQLTERGELKPMSLDHLEETIDQVLQDEKKRIEEEIKMEKDRNLSMHLIKNAVNLLSSHDLQEIYDSTHPRKPLAHRPVGIEITISFISRYLNFHFDSCFLHFYFK